MKHMNISQEPVRFLIAIHFYFQKVSDGIGI